jgi:hypothetical protein
MDKGRLVEIFRRYDDEEFEALSGVIDFCDGTKKIVCLNYPDPCIGDFVNIKGYEGTYRITEEVNWIKEGF